MEYVLRHADISIRDTRSQIGFASIKYAKSVLRAAAVLLSRSEESGVGPRERFKGKVEQLTVRNVERVTTLPHTRLGELTTQITTCRPGQSSFRHLNEKRHTGLTLKAEMAKSGSNRDCIRRTFEHRSNVLNAIVPGREGEDYSMDLGDQAYESIVSRSEKGGTCFESRGTRDGILLKGVVWRPECLGCRL
uniref:IMS_C domain-containing protein n=1 Tax=Haemonchus placei TaxID=6290 RepID=A0A0N4WWC5_HAEPC